MSILSCSTPGSQTSTDSRCVAGFEPDNNVDISVAIQFGSLRIEPAAYIASIAGAAIDLRPREFELLVYLARQAGRVVTRDRLLADVWDLHWDSSTKTVDMHIVALRRKLGQHRDRHRTWRRLAPGRPMKRRITTAIV